MPPSHVSRASIWSCSEAVTRADAAGALRCSLQCWFQDMGMSAVRPHAERLRRQARGSFSESWKRPRIPFLHHSRPGQGAVGFTLIELIVVVAAVVILSATLGPIAFSWIEEGKAARARGDAAAVASAMDRFFQDTTRWPGQVEILKSNSAIRFLTVGDPDVAAFPVVAGSVGIGSTTCSSGLSGVAANVTSFAAATPSKANSLNVLDLLLRPPPPTDYRNWHGPYLAPTVGVDPWGTVYVINIVPLFCGETVSADAPSGALGFGWVLSGGPNHTIQTPFTASQAASDSDDVGVSLSKRMTQSTAP